MNKIRLQPETIEKLVGLWAKANDPFTTEADWDVMCAEAGNQLGWLLNELENRRLDTMAEFDNASAYGLQLKEALARIEKFEILLKHIADIETRTKQYGWINEIEKVLASAQTSNAQVNR